MATKTLAKSTFGLQDHVLAFRTSRGAYLVHSFWRPDFQKFWGGLEAASRDRKSKPQVKTASRDRKPQFDIGGCKSRPQVKTASQDRKSRPIATTRDCKSKPQEPQLETGGCKSRPQVETASQDRKSRLQAATGDWNRNSRSEPEPRSSDNQDRKSRPKAATGEWSRNSRPEPETRSSDRIATRGPNLNLEALIATFSVWEI